MNVLSKPELEAKLKDENALIRRGVLREENPLDLSRDFDEFMEACRRGDLKRCQQLISAGVNINGKDRFDYTPLIAASLCGHFDLVRLLLEAGARAERNTFQGERCIYNALNDKIRKLLVEYDFSKNTDPLQPWASHITSLLSLTSPRTADISLAGAGGSFELHKFLLAARSAYFGTKLGDAPETKTWKLPSSIPAEAFAVVVRYLYLDELPRDLGGSGSSGASDEEIVRGIDKVSKSLGIEHLWDAVLVSNDRRLARQRYRDEVQRAQAQLEAFFHECVVGHKVVVEADSVMRTGWTLDNPVFADCFVQADGAISGVGDDSASEQPGLKGPSETGLATLYPAHKAMLIRSPYFRTMFGGPFMEAQQTEHLRVIKVDCSAEVLEVVLAFLYTEKAECPLEAALDVLYAADMLLLDKLKTKAAGIISALGSGAVKTSTGGDDTHSLPSQQAGNGAKGRAAKDAEPINVYDVIHAAWDLRVQRLEEFAARYIAGRLEDYVDDAEFAELIRESADRLKNREQTDTIELLDDIRYYLSERFRLRFEHAGWEEMMDGGEAASPGNEDPSTGAGSHGEYATQTQRPEEDEGRDPSRLDSAPRSGRIRTLDGGMVDDEFESDAANYQILLDKIDSVLERLRLDA